ncbi:unnamed protein product [Ectocarpus sp. CCAP 1310/34]|nr:unnamed protein product [Ectocarpus sp. CCAP 1310/34]
MARVSTTFGSGGVVAAASAALLLLLLALPQGSRAQPGGGGDGGPPGSTSSATVECATDGTDAHYEEFLAGEGITMARWTATETGCPNHINWPLNPNAAGVMSVNQSVPAYPMLIASGGTTDLSSAAGTIGLMRNGVSMFSAWAVDAVVEYEDTAFYLEADTFDPCGGHATPTGAYHYHGTAGCLQEQAGAVKGEHSPVLGWSYDGFPIYGQLGPGGVEMKMCGADGAHDTACLDLCSGYEATIDEDEFTYRYYTSCGFDESFFPFTLNCFRGCCPTGNTCSDRLEACGVDADVGYTDDYVPVALESLDEFYDAELVLGDDLELIGSRTTVNCTLYLGSESEVGTGDVARQTTPSPTPAAVADADQETPSPSAATTVPTMGGGSGGGGSAGDAPTPSPEAAARSAPEPTASPSSGGDMDDADTSGAPGGISSSTPGIVFLGFMATAAMAFAS